LIMLYISIESRQVNELVLWGLIFAIWSLVYLRHKNRNWAFNRLHKEIFIPLAVSFFIYVAARVVLGVTIAAITALVFFTVYFFHNFFAPYLTGMKKYQAAERYLSFLERFFPYNISIIIQHAQLFLFEKDYEKAIEAATQALDLISPKKGKLKKTSLTQLQLLRTLQIRYQAFLEMEDYELALSDAETLIQLAPDEKNGVFLRGVALLNLGEPEAAKEDFNHLIGLLSAPVEQASLHHSLGFADYILGDYTSSMQHYDQTLQLAPISVQEAFAPTHINRGIIYFRQNDMEQAWKAYKTAQQLNPSYESTLLGLAVLHAAEGQWNEALGLWRDLATKHDYFGDIDKVIHRHYRWTPPMGDLVRQIAARASA
jgi:tetratricopeptide (TPR) repeat protein